MSNKILEWLILGVEADTPYEIPYKYKDFTDWYFIVKAEKVSVRKRFPREHIENEKRRFNAYKKLGRFAKTKKDRQTLSNKINEQYENLAGFYNYLSNEVLSILDIWLSEKWLPEKESRNVDIKRNWIDYPMKMHELLEKHYYGNSGGAIKLIEENVETIKTQALRFKRRSDYYSKKLENEN